MSYHENFWLLSSIVKELIACLQGIHFIMWKSQLGSKEVKTITQADDDDWETDPDFVVGLPLMYDNAMCILYVIIHALGPYKQQ